MKQYLGYIIKKAMGKGKVSPTIKSVKPNLTKVLNKLRVKDLQKISKP